MHLALKFGKKELNMFSFSFKHSSSSMFKINISQPLWWLLSWMCWIKTTSAWSKLLSSELSELSVDSWWWSNTWLTNWIHFWVMFRQLRQQCVSISMFDCNWRWGKFNDVRGGTRWNKQTLVVTIMTRNQQEPASCKCKLPLPLAIQCHWIDSYFNHFIA